MSFAYTFTQLAEVISASEFQVVRDDRVRSFCTDTRKPTATTDTVFVAISGSHHDAHRFIPDAYALGIRSFIVEKKDVLSTFNDVNWAVVTNSLLAFQEIAAFHRRQFNIPVIGITGSNGKTMVKEWLNQLLADEFTIARSPKSYNSQIGVALSVLGLEQAHSLGIFEAGISLPSEMERLQSIIHPTLGIMTNLGEAHLENFPDSAALALEKLDLFKETPIIIAPGDNPILNDVMVHKLHEHRILTWGQLAHCTLVIEKIDCAGEHTHIRYRYQEITFEIDIPFADKASIENTSTCVLTMLHLGYSPEVIKLRTTRLHPVSMRLQLIEGTGNSTLINDAYSSDINSLRIALDFLVRHAGSKTISVILSDIVQSATPEHELHHSIAQLLHEHKVQRIIGIGEGFMRNTTVYRLFNQATFFPSTEGYLESCKPNDHSGEIVLVKGAREFKLERIIDFLQIHTHETVLEIDLNAMRHNLVFFREKLAPSVKLMVMVKAAGYGAGAREVAELLEFNKVDYLAVAYTDEGVMLRQGGISLPIMVLNAELTGHQALIRHRIEPVIFSQRSLLSFVDALKASHFQGSYPIHIKLDTGMHRLGFVEGELENLLDQLHSFSEVKVVSVFTHLAASDAPNHDDFTRTQLFSFEKMCATIRTALGYDFMRHAGNTGAIQRFPEAHYDMVRLGIGLYGISAFAEEQTQLKNVSTLKTCISQIKQIKSGESIGYNRKYIAPKDMTIATIPVGYADGLRRTLSNGVGEVFIQNSSCKIVGNVCMDMTMVDVSGISAQEGEEVILFNSAERLIAFSDRCETIPYEVLTSIPARVKRVYLEE
ncbi:MAG: bifunctional UDP-N-acetylmuramoyl-tripeptide:D-alanyl-D-alanine ligase/alanine racemase [Flavobacteriales bacterium]